MCVVVLGVLACWRCLTQKNPRENLGRFGAPRATPSRPRRTWQGDCVRAMEHKERCQQRAPSLPFRANGLTWALESAQWLAKFEMAGMQVQREVDKDAAARPLSRLVPAVLAGCWALSISELSVVRLLVHAPGLRPPRPWPRPSRQHVVARTEETFAQCVLGSAQGLLERAEAEKSRVRLVSSSNIPDLPTKTSPFMDARHMPRTLRSHGFTLWPDPHPLASPPSLGKRSSGRALVCQLQPRVFRRSLFLKLIWAGRAWEHMKGALECKVPAPSDSTFHESSNPWEMSSPACSWREQEGGRQSLKPARACVSGIDDRLMALSCLNK